MGEQMGELRCEGGGGGGGYEDGSERGRGTDWSLQPSGIRQVSSWVGCGTEERVWRLAMLSGKKAGILIGGYAFLGYDG